MNDWMQPFRAKDFNIEKEVPSIRRKTTVIFLALTVIMVLGVLLVVFVSWYRGEHWEKTFSEQEWQFVESCVESSEEETTSAYRYMQILFNVLGYDKSEDLQIVSARMEYLSPETVNSIFEYDPGSGGYALVLTDDMGSEYLLWSHYHREGLAIDGVKQFLMLWIL